MTAKDITAEINGKVWQIEAAAGTDLEEDDPIIILESMKMEIPVNAPCNGKILEILVAEGDEIKEGQVVARFQPA